jgi:hypothetical protein
MYFLQGCHRGITGSWNGETEFYCTSFQVLHRYRHELKILGQVFRKGTFLGGSSTADERFIAVVSLGIAVQVK